MVSGFVCARGAVFASHCAATHYYSAISTFGGAVAVDVLPGGSLQAAVAIG
jgi:hypothetical protein